MVFIGQMFRVEKHDKILVIKEGTLYQDGEILAVKFRWIFLKAMKRRQLSGCVGTHSFWRIPNSSFYEKVFGVGAFAF